MNEDYNPKDVKFLGVTTTSTKFIPLLNRRGPFSFPINIHASHYEDIQKLGFDLKVHRIVLACGKVIPFHEGIEKEKNGTIVNTKEESQVVTEVPVVEAPVTSAIQEPVVEETKEEIKVEVLTKEEYAAMTKADLVKYLNKMKSALPSEILPFEKKNVQDLLLIIDTYLLNK